MLKAVKPTENRDQQRFHNMEDRMVTSLMIACQIDPQGIDLARSQPGPQQIGADPNSLWLHNWVRPKLELWQEQQATLLLSLLIDELQSIQSTPSNNEEQS